MQDNPTGPLLPQRIDVEPVNGFKWIPLSRNLRDISIAFRSAAERLTGTNRYGTISDLPIIYLYRHAIETAIKAIVLTTNSTLNSKGELQVFARGHDPRSQLEDLRSVARRLANPLSGLLEDLINRFGGEDPDGMTSRYPTNKTGERPLRFVNEASFDLLDFAADCDSALDELAALLGYIEAEDLDESDSN